MAKIENELVQVHRTTETESRSGLPANLILPPWLSTLIAYCFPIVYYSVKWKWTFKQKEKITRSTLFFITTPALPVLQRKLQVIRKGEGRHSVSTFTTWLKSQKHLPRHRLVSDTRMASCIYQFTVAFWSLLWHFAVYYALT